MKTWVWILLPFVLVGAFLGPKAVTYVSREMKQWEQSSVDLPPVENPQVSSSSPSLSSSIASSAREALRSAVNWDVPFTSQAPFGNWDALHGEACEEASVLMVLRYFNSESIESPEDADAAITSLVHINEDLGFPVDDTAEQMKQLVLSQNSLLTTSLLKNPTIEEVQAALSKGNLIIVPLAGRQLGNPYYRQPGPLYHVLVLRGYTADGRYVITNDPGTKRGEAYVYTWETLLTANHDWNGGDVEGGERVMLIVGE